VRLPKGMTARIDLWAEKHEVPRSEAIRSLVELGLTVKPSRAPTRKAADRAAELASDVIDRHADRSAPATEQESRKLRLLKGPSAFRDMRKDRSK
jgi:metal-responsive CopG/Arc/MetJ family transcriptional regulator